MHPTDHLEHFVSDRDGCSWQTGPDRGWFKLCSGTWRSERWLHDVVIVGGGPQDGGGCAILYITGGDVNEPDLAEARQLAARSGLPVAMLFHIPNQPLLDRWEDDLIAHTFEQYIDTGDPSWPLLFPMARAAIRAIDMLQELGFERFVVTGASKRGWTTWLGAATGDPRIAGIAPMVIDNLNFPAQMAHQVASWGAYSEQIQDYTSRELQNEMDSERGAELTTMMDPINYVGKIKCPILIVNGANDRYWTVDALSLYWDLLPRTTRCLIVPNVGHVLGDKVQMIETVAAFASACASGGLLPALRARVREGLAEIDAPNAKEVRIWTALSETRDFRDSEWDVVAASGSYAFDLPASLNVAAMVEARYSGETGEYSLSTPVQVFPNS